MFDSISSSHRPARFGTVNRRGRLSALAGALLCCLALPGWGQGPSADWRTVETEHFRVHYPVEAEAWTHRAVERMEAIRARVEEEIGYQVEAMVDVLVIDPTSRANGSAWPFRKRPRMLLYTSPPGPQSAIGYYTDWGELLITHEDAHLVHLLRPSRNGVQQLWEKVLGLGPISRRAPRWMTEGYATYVEGRLTGSGRPNGDYRATVLRRKAQAGELPSYGALSGGGAWLGRSMAYLAGSAYVEWLVEREGEQSLRDLWARMTARADRSFEAAFAGVFGAPPAKLYNRFRAELTHQALELEEAIEPRLREGELWQDLSWSTGPPALSPDGQQLALVLRSKEGPSRLVVWSTAPNTEAEERWQKGRDELLQNDPEDVPAVRRKPLSRKPVHQLVTRLGASPSQPRWSPDGKSILYVRYEPDGEGFLHPDLFRWTPESGQVQRLTVGADVRDPNPHPSGTWAVAVRHRHGLSQLVRVDLTSGKVEAITSAVADTVYAHPRISPDGEQLAYVRHREGVWRLILRELASPATGEAVERQLETSGLASVSYPAWGPGGQLYATVGEDGFLTVRAFELSGQTGPEAASKAITNSLAGALAAAPTPDGAALFYLQLEADGLDLRRLELGNGEPTPAARVAVAEGQGGIIEASEASAASQQAEASQQVAASQHVAIAESDSVTVKSSEPNSSKPSSSKPNSSKTSRWPRDAVDYAPALRPERPEPPPYARAQVPEARPYGFGKQELRPLFGGIYSPSVESVELGVRGGDVVGRTSYLVLGSSGDGGARGGAAALAYRGLPVELSAHLYGSSERPSRQPTERPGLGETLDADRFGLELAAFWQRRHRGGGLSWRAHLLWEELEPKVTDRSVDRALLGLRLAGRHTVALGSSWRLRGGLGLELDLGETDQRSWSRYGGQGSLSLASRDGEWLSLSWGRRWSGGNPSLFDLYRVGGMAQTLRPRALEGGRISVAALPEGSLLGEEQESQGLRVGLPSWPLRLFYERHRTGPGRGSLDSWLALRGVELTLERGPFPLLGLPAVELNLGLAEILDQPFEDDIEGWVGVVWRP